MEAETAYLNDVTRMFPDSTSDQAQHRTSMMSVSSSLRCRSGVAAVDTEAIVILRSLDRIAKARLARVKHQQAAVVSAAGTPTKLEQDPSTLQPQASSTSLAPDEIHETEETLTFELGVVRSALERIMQNVKVIAAEGGGGGGGGIVASGGSMRRESTASGSLEKRRSSLAFGRRNSRKVKMMYGGEDVEEEALKGKARNGIWGTLLNVLLHSKGSYVFTFPPEVVAAKAISAQEEAKVCGLTMFGASFLLFDEPQVTLRKFPLPKVPTEGTGVIQFLLRTGKKVLPTTSSVWGQSTVSSLIAPTPVPFMTLCKPQSFVTLDLCDAVVFPIGYRLHSCHHIMKGYFPRTWKLLGSLDGRTWSTLREHANDTSFDKNHSVCQWPINITVGSEPQMPPVGVYRYFRIVQTGPNSFGSDELQISSIEVFGSVMLCENLDPFPTTSDPMEPRPLAPAPVLPLPDPTTINRKKRK